MGGSVDTKQTHKQTSKKKSSPGVLHQKEWVITQMLLPNGTNGWWNRALLKVSEDSQKRRKKMTNISLG